MPYVWNEVSLQGASETDLAFTGEVTIDVATDLPGEDMRDHVAAYRDRLADTPVGLDLTEEPTVNVVQRESRIRPPLAVHRPLAAGHAGPEGALRGLSTG